MVMVNKKEVTAQLSRIVSTANSLPMEGRAIFMAVVIKALEKELRLAIMSAMLLCVLFCTDISPFDMELAAKEACLYYSL
jgi:hypothetical protein